MPFKFDPKRMTSFISLVTPIFLCASLHGQIVDYCNYFTLDVSAIEYNGKNVTTYSPEILYPTRDAFGKFLKEHENRFIYILWNKVDDLSQIASIYPDTLTMQTEFCRILFTKDVYLEYFTDLSPAKLTTWKLKQITFTSDEMMRVASRFFYANKINPSDTTIVRSICVGKNGQNEFSTDRDMTLLEAFTFEAIFYYLLKSKSPQFERNFDGCLSHILEMNKSSFNSFDSLLSTVRNECYLQMEKDEDLKYKLLKYYRKSRKNLNFKIVETNI